TDTNTTVTTIAMGGSPVSVAVTPDGKNAYVANRQISTTSRSIISVVDTTSNAVAANIPLPNVDPAHVALTPDGKHVYIACFNTGILVVDTATRTVATTVPLGNGGPRAIAFTPDGNHAFIAMDDAVAVLDTATSTVAATIAVERFATNIAVIPLP